MAKKKTAKKKASKKKASKKKPAKKKPAKKKPAKQGAQKGSGFEVRLTFKCSGGCRVNDRNAHLFPGNTVHLEAKGTAVHIEFVHASPFDPARTVIDIPADGTYTTVVADDADFGDYEYRLRCADCSSAFGNPKMIVP